jgi:hypothetical protein
MSLFQKPATERCSALLEHPVFNKIDCAIAYQIDRIDIAHPAKCNMTHAYLKLYFKEFKKGITEFIESYEDANGPMNFIILYKETLTRINKEALGVGIPEIFLNRYDQLCKGQKESVYISLENILNSHFYSQAEDKIVAMLDILLSHLVFIILDAERTLNDLNGKMEVALAGSIFDRK